MEEGTVCWVGGVFEAWSGGCGESINVSGFSGLGINVGKEIGTGVKETGGGHVTKS